MAGIYRVSGVKSKVEKLCQAFENGAELVDLTDIHPNVVANVLKLYMRQLPEPLLTFKLYQDFVRIAKDFPANNSTEIQGAPEELRDLCKKLPRHHYQTLAFLMHHLKRVSNESEVNNMPPSNLGIVFGPTLLRTSEGSASLSSLVDTVYQTRVIELLIIYAVEIFGSQDLHLPKDYSIRYQAMEESLFARVPPVMRSVSFLERSRRCKDVEIVSTQTDRRREIREEITIPGYVGDKESPMVSYELSHSTDELLLGPVSDDELPDFLLPDDSRHTKKSPLIPRGSAAKIVKCSLKDYHGLEGVSPAMLSTQDSLDKPHHKLRKSFSDITPVKKQSMSSQGSVSGESGQSQSESGQSQSESSASRSSEHSDKEKHSSSCSDKSTHKKVSDTSDHFQTPEPSLSGLQEVAQSEERQRILSRKHAPSLTVTGSLTSETDSSLDSDYVLESHHKQSQSSSHLRLAGSTPASKAQTLYTATKEPGQQRRKETVKCEDCSDTTDQEAKVDNVASPDSSQESDMCNVEGASQSRGVQEGASQRNTPSLCTANPSTALMSGVLPDSENDSMRSYVSPYLTSDAQGNYTLGLGSSLVYSRSTVTQYDEKRRITTVTGPKNMNYDENKVKIQVPGMRVAHTAPDSHVYQESESDICEKEGGSSHWLPPTVAASGTTSKSGAEVERDKQQWPVTVTEGPESGTRVIESGQSVVVSEKASVSKSPVPHTVVSNLQTSAERKLLTNQVSGGDGQTTNHSTVVQEDSNSTHTTKQVTLPGFTSEFTHIYRSVRTIAASVSGQAGGDTDAGDQPASLLQTSTETTASVKNLPAMLSSTEGHTAKKLSGNRVPRFV